MADASRFPRLAVPFAIVGGAAGWLSASLCGSPLLGFPVSQPITAGCAAVAGAWVGALFKFLAVGRRYRYELDDPDPEIRRPSDTGWIHVPVLLLTGAGTALLVRLITCAEWDDAATWALSGALCTAAFIPVCLAVLAAGRRAQRARLGSIVADSDRRAVWGILATLLAVMTVEALPDWLGGSPDRPARLVLAALIAASAAVLVRVLLADRRACLDARAVIDAGLSVRQPEEMEESDSCLPLVDLGLGEQTLKRVTPGVAPYRDRERAVSLVRGSPEMAVAALARASLRSRVGLLAVGVTALAHGLATLPAARAFCSRVLTTERAPPLALVIRQTVGALGGGAR
jgi:hypothetical protein